MKNIMNRLVAYLFVPLIFVLMGAGILYVAFKKPAENAASSYKALIGEQPPEFAENNAPDRVEVSKDELPLYGAFYANIYSDRFNYSSKIYYGDSTRIYKKGICHKDGSQLPGFNGNVVLYAANDGPFWLLKDMAKDDVIAIDTGYGKYKYQVTEAKVGYLKDFQNLQSANSGGETLVMYTEYPFKSNRITVTEEPKEHDEGDCKIVLAKKISGPSVTLKEGQNG